MFYVVDHRRDSSRLLTQSLLDLQDAQDLGQRLGLMFMFQDIHKPDVGRFMVGFVRRAFASMMSVFVKNLKLNCNDPPVPMLDVG